MEDNNSKMQITGKIAQFPKGMKAVHALQLLEKLKVNQNKLWYVLVEDQGTDLKMVKYNRCQGVDLLEYTAELKQQYLTKYKNEPNVLEAIKQIEVVGEVDFSIIKNIPNITLEGGKTLIGKIAADIIKLLAD